MTERLYGYEVAWRYEHRHGTIAALACDESKTYRYVAEYVGRGGRLRMTAQFDTFRGALRWFKAMATPPSSLFRNTDRKTQQRLLKAAGYID
ncbi:MAG: hypothetical protein ACK4S4_15595 [Pyrinomonadaceae bacterium]